MPHGNANEAFFKTKCRGKLEQIYNVQKQNKQKYGNQLLSSRKKGLEKLVDLHHFKKLKQLTKLNSLQRMETLC